MKWGLPQSVKVHKWANIATKDLTCGENCRIDAFVTITGVVSIGSHVHLSTGSCIFGGAGVSIGDGCSLSPGAKIFTASDDMQSDLLATPQTVERGGKEAPVSVGPFSVVGANSVVLPGVSIGSEVQIGANAVVRTNIPCNQVWAGVPAHYLCPRAKLDRARMLGLDIPVNTGA